MNGKYKYFIENQNREWYSFVFRRPHTISNDVGFTCQCADCAKVPQWTKDPESAMKFDSENEAVDFLVSRNWLNFAVTEHEFVK